MTVDFLVFGGDKRQQALAELLRQRFSVAACGGSPQEDLPESARRLVLPVPSSWPDGAPRGVSWDALEPFLRADVTVYGGALGTLADQLREDGVRAVDLLQDETAVTENARLTADAAILLVMQHLRESLFALPCCVIGCGRIGSRLCPRLQAFGARVCAVSATPGKRADQAKEGFAAIAPEDLAVQEPRLIFNTAPVQLVPPQALAALPETALWVELASAPGGLPHGMNFRFSRLPAVGLPGKLLPVSAAGVLYRAILRDL